MIKYCASARIKYCASARIKYCVSARIKYCASARIKYNMHSTRLLALSFVIYNIQIHESIEPVAIKVQ